MKWPVDIVMHVCRNNFIRDSLASKLLQTGSYHTADANDERFFKKANKHRTYLRRQDVETLEKEHSIRE